MEWFKGEITMQGYPDWRHPGIAFSKAGVKMTYENRAKCERLFRELFGRPMPHELSYLCPDCESRVIEELPELAAADTGGNLRDTPREPWR
ncbi:MAG: hypothetical protein ACK47B_10435 [Armatimonadota bacterium]